jgi:hypothetical protein
LERIRRDLLPVPHFQVVFTLPAQLRPLALANPREIYRLLFHAAWRTLQQLAGDSKHLGGKIGAVMVLHTSRRAGRIC